MENKKFELSEMTLVCKNPKGKIVTLRQIRAIKNFGTIKKGDLGGYIQSEINLSHSGLAWVSDNARVFDCAEVKDNAQLSGDAVLCDYACIIGNSIVTERATVLDNAIIADNAKIYGSAIVQGCAIIMGTVEVYGHAKVNEDCFFSGDLIVLDR